MEEYALGSEARPLRVAVVGSGPSAFYAIGALFKHPDLHVSVDLFDRLPTPYGLVRGGVAPDHQKIKNVIRVYSKTAAHDGFRFFGNVTVGQDLTIEDLTRHYDQVVLAIGNESDRKMGIEGEDLEGAYSATEFVGWYNGHPDFQNREFDLAHAERVAVVGNGNVAMDVTRILAQAPEELAASDIAEHALEVLRTSKVREIVLLGRRGPAQAAFSPPEIKEIGALDSCDLVVAPEEMDLDELSHRWLGEQAAPSAKKNVDFLTEHCTKESRGLGRRVLCRFLVSPVELLGADGRLTAVKIERNELHDDDDGTPRPRGTGQFETLEVELLFKAVGYRGEPLAGVPFDQRSGTIPNRDGRVVDPDTGEAIPDLYVVGWAKRGPTGLIGTNSPDSADTVARMLEDIVSRQAPSSLEKSPNAIVGLLEQRGIDFVSFEDWQRLDGEEIARGEAKGKIREKFTTVEDMMTAVRRLRDEGESRG